MAKSTINPTVYNQLYRNQVNRGEQTREDDDYIKIPEITIYDVDYSILQYIRNSIKPEVQDRDRMIDVPVMYGSGELWSQIQSNGFMRDEKNKLLCPVITLSRTRMEEYKAFAKLDVNNRVSSRVYYRQGYTQNSDRYGFSNRGDIELPKQEIYVSLIPEYYYVYYDLSIWTDFNEQLNKVIEQFIPVNNFVWGNDYQFVTNIEDFTFSAVNISKQERIVKASTRLRVLATLTPAFVERKSSIQKAFAIKKVNMSERLF
jgi:hypothetical protein